MTGFATSSIRRWERFWFQDVPPDSFALLRIAVGTLGFVGIVSLVPVSTFWGLDGLTPLPGGGLGLKTWLATHGLGEVAGWALFLALSGSFVSMALGYRTGLAIAACFVLSVIHQRYWNRLGLGGGHHVLLVTLLYLLWADCSGRPSLDAWLARRRGKTEAKVVQPIWPLRLIRIQISVIYLTTGLWKFSSESWRDGSALHYVLNLNSFARFPGMLPQSLEWLATLGTYVTLGWEIAFPFLLFHRVTRRIALGMGVMIHLGMAIAMELGLFSWVMIATYLAFLDPEMVAKFMSRRDSPRAAVIQASTTNSAAGTDLRPAV